ncbi:hypothetical protein FHS31_003283 [Sphingomonas vulcanisoli]|uniref:Porin n=1 Tax=Sphingomonas vulcanisoli TaxID=1658060 RepID=A0ABX0TVS9_9SPHN|nr:hypothetical protein [Sphingomonas vulcanisoli]NIJ09646.1 hypothetical protein [Sphingomonas vulcanisoli]
MKIVLSGAALAVAVAAPASAQEMSMPPMPGMEMPAPAHHDMAAMDGMMGDGRSAAASGTSRLPAEDKMQGLHIMAGDWMLMAHGYAWGAVTDQGGPRGANKAYVQSMAMVEAGRPIGPGVDLTLRTMLSLDPLMGERGYPNLFATGETAHGVPLVDRQHPHDLFMELSARIDVAAGPGKLFVYGGLPGEPALGPSAFMHRGSARFLAEAPITHHWFDSTHITFGVVTAGYATKLWQIEASAFNGREPGENRWNIETGALDSWSVRATVTPSAHWAGQVSYGYLRHPEKAHPGENEGRLTASVSYAGSGLDVTAGFSRKDRLPGRALTAWFGEATYVLAGPHAIFGRIENVDNDELFETDPASPLHDRAFGVTKVTGGYSYTLPLGNALSVALGGQVSVYSKPKALEAAYGDAPVSGTLFAKLMLGR